MVQNETAQASPHEGLPGYGAWVKARRTALTLTQSALAIQVGCAVATLQKIEQGARLPSAQMAQLLARELGVPDEDAATAVAAARAGIAPTFHTKAPQAWRVDDLLGRDDLMNVLDVLLDRGEARLITLLGPGGAGKTSLAVAFAQAASARFADGARVVSLAQVADANGVPAELIATLAPEQGISTAAGLAEALAQRHQLIVLDNFEHVLPAAAHVKHLIAVATKVTVVVTSREALKLPGERVVRVGALAPEHATALFLRAARAANPHWQPSPAETRAIAALCEALDHLPLAILLCAARVAIMQPSAMLRRVVGERGAPRLNTIEAAGDGARPRRHRSMEGTIRWSYRLLAPDEQHAFLALGVCANGFDLEVAEALLAENGEPTAAWDAVSSLLAKCLLTRGQGEAHERFGMYELVRAFAQDEARDTGSLNVLRNAHLRVYAARAHVHARIADFVARNNALQTDLPNLYAAMRHGWSADVDAGMNIFRALVPWWRARYRFEDQLQIAREALAMVGPGHPGLCAELSLQAGSGAVAIDALAEADRHLAAASAYYETAPGHGLLWRVRDLQGLACQHRHDLAGALAFHKQAVELAARLDDDFVHAKTVLHVARILVMSGEFAEARDMLLPLHPVFDRHASDINSLVWVTTLAPTHMMLGDFDAAWQLLQSGLQQTRQLPANDMHAYLCMLLASISMTRGNHADGLRYARMAHDDVAGWREQEAGRISAELLYGLVLMAHGEMVEGLRMLRRVADRAVWPEHPTAGKVALDAGLALGLRHEGQYEQAGQILARVAELLADGSIARACFVDAVPWQVQFAREACGLAAPSA